MNMSPEFAEALDHVTRVPAPITFEDAMAIPGVNDLVFETAPAADRLDRFNAALRLAIEDMQALAIAHNGQSADRAHALNWASTDLVNSLASLGAEFISVYLDQAPAPAPAPDAVDNETPHTNNETISD